jgi:hypothetical protein
MSDQIVSNNFVKSVPFEMTSAQAENFWSKVLIGPKDLCWLYIGNTVDRNGRPRFSVTTNGICKTIMAHRIAYFLEYELMPADSIKRTCKNDLCCNPHHLQVVT